MSEQKERRLYEAMFIFSASLSSEARTKAVDRVREAITSRQGDIKTTFDQGRKRLAYEIDGKREGYYMVLFFEVDPSVISEIWRDYQLNEDLIRYLCLQADKVPENLEFKSLVQS